jgi:hypothetical protein
VHAPPHKTNTFDGLPKTRVTLPRKKAANDARMESGGTFAMVASVSVMDGAADSPMPNHVTFNTGFREHIKRDGCERMSQHSRFTKEPVCDCRQLHLQLRRCGTRSINFDPASILPAALGDVALHARAKGQMMAGDGSKAPDDVHALL